VNASVVLVVTHNNRSEGMSRQRLTHENHHHRTIAQMIGSQGLYLVTVEVEDLPLPPPPAAISTPVPSSTTTPSPRSS
jgi:hypothetical protein